MSATPGATPTFRLTWAGSRALLLRAAGALWGPCLLPFAALRSALAIGLGYALRQ